VALGVDLFHEIVSFVCLPQDKADSELVPLDDIVATIRTVFQSDFERYSFFFPICFNLFLSFFLFFFPELFQSCTLWWCLLNS
jgi:hypothetical protein